MSTWFYFDEPRIARVLVGSEYTLIRRHFIRDSHGFGYGSDITYLFGFLVCPANDVFPDYRRYQFEIDHECYWCHEELPIASRRVDRYLSGSVEIELPGQQLTDEIISNACGGKRPSRNQQLGLFA